MSPLTQASLTRHLLGREVYRRTEYLAPRGVGGVALAAVREASPQPLSSPVVEARVLAGPGQAAWVDSPAADMGNATALTRAAAAHHAPNARAYVVLGRFAHVNFIWEPAPVPVRVTEVVPPSPPKPLAQAEQAVAFDEDLPPVRLDLDAVSVAGLAAAHPADAYLGGSVAFLDTRPAARGDRLLTGCERSPRLHRHFYGDELCPRARAGEGNGLTSRNAA